MRHTHCAMTGLAGVALLLLAAQASAADEPEIAVEASASEIFIGESVDYVVEIRNVKNPAPRTCRRCARISTSSPMATSRTINRPRSFSTAGSPSRTASVTPTVSA